MVSTVYVPVMLARMSSGMHLVRTPYICAQSHLCVTSAQVRGAGSPYASGLCGSHANVDFSSGLPPPGPVRIGRGKDGPSTQSPCKYEPCTQAAPVILAQALHGGAISLERNGWQQMFTSSFVPAAQNMRLCPRAHLCMDDPRSVNAVRTTPAHTI